ncbi:MAG: thiamine-phosphate kinase [Candidatus Kryptonium sp.]|nr:thiamine-phosphate kinase [Candidatus Kryptonium sp.]MCX7762820.1 thiamine-phosphate kinase [Candidatus Kryptonium sp.]MDW8108838.1 thiamine-phosphate kinase [Candidatus Kryptonium sp.]
MNESFTEISQIGEFGLIARLNEIIQPYRDSFIIKGIGDDAAVYIPTEGKVQVVTTDALIEGIHFDLTFVSLRNLGWKAMVVNLSDLAAMLAIPRYALITIAIPRKISVEMMENLYFGIKSACNEFNFSLIGGDTTTTFGNMAISVTMIGEANKDEIPYRSGAKVGDYICVTGTLGLSYAGLKILLREKKKFMEAEDKQNFKPNFEPFLKAIEKHLKPIPRLDVASKLKDLKVKVNSMIDISDGLSSDLRHICRQSNVGAEIYETSLPVDDLVKKIAKDEFNEDYLMYVLHGGEDYELLFTVSENELKKLNELYNEVKVIGRILDREQGIKLIKEDKSEVDIETGGWDHFKTKI